MDWNWIFLLKIVIRLILSVIVGLIIGSERAKHGRAAGMRTHTLVALGACLTSLMSVYLSEVVGVQGDIMRISAQVISGIGFLGAGMIIIKNNDNSFFIKMSPFLLLGCLHYSTALFFCQALFCIF